jgi:hypothetical protein
MCDGWSASASLTQQYHADSDVSIIRSEVLSADQSSRVRSRVGVTAVVNFCPAESTHTCVSLLWSSSEFKGVVMQPVVLSFDFFH